MRNMAKNNGNAGSWSPAQQNGAVRSEHLNQSVVPSVAFFFSKLKKICDLKYMHFINIDSISEFMMVCNNIIYSQIYTYL